MIHALKLINLPPQNQGLSPIIGEFFSIQTCQRTLVLSFNEAALQGWNSIKEAQIYHGEKAYEFLLETICGLKSKILGENEIVNQFKEAYQNYLTSSNPNSLIIEILEKLLKDNKTIRNKHLKHLTLPTYAGIVRKTLSQFEKRPVLILGSGKMAKDLFQNLNRKYDLILSARNEQKVQEFIKTYHCEYLEWLNYSSYLSSPVIINTVGAEGLKYDNQFLGHWMSQHPDHLFIDLANPSPICPDVFTQTKQIWLLEDVLAEGQRQSAEKKNKIAAAKTSIQETVKQRGLLSTFHFPYSWDDLQFA